MLLTCKLKIHSPKERSRSRIDALPVSYVKQIKARALGRLKPKHQIGLIGKQRRYSSCVYEQHSPPLFIEPRWTSDIKPAMVLPECTGSSSTASSQVDIVIADMTASLTCPYQGASTEPSTSISRPVTVASAQSRFQISCTRRIIRMRGPEARRSYVWLTAIYQGIH